MKRLHRPLMDFLRDANGATAIEYALIAGGIGTVIASTIFTLGDTVFVGYYERIAEALIGESPSGD